MLSRGPTWPAVPWDASYPARTTCHCASMMLSPDDIDRIANTNQDDFIFDSIVRHDLPLRVRADDVCDAAISRYNSMCWRAIAQPPAYPCSPFDFI